MQYVNSANRSPCDVIKKMADVQEYGDWKLQIFAYLHIDVTTLSITIGLYSWYCFIYRNKNLRVSGTLRVLFITGTNSSFINMVGICCVVILAVLHFKVNLCTKFSNCKKL